MKRLKVTINGRKKNGNLNNNICIFVSVISPLNAKSWNLNNGWIGDYEA